jgi:hypothetical protein
MKGMIEMLRNPGYAQGDKLGVLRSGFFGYGRRCDLTVLERMAKVVRSGPEIEAVVL